MRPIQVTGVTGNSNPVPLDVYATASQTTVYLKSAGAPTIQVTYDNVFDTTIVPNWVAPPTAAANTIITLPQGTRAVRGTGMAPADVLSVSQQGIR